ncbi:MAG: hypothetical protein UZ17_ACD001000208 [Acidobacteria bacterium OLB17]|nr:MAG: hypothetical protein UZ17_ACD001000208 [Acidobacteria bacterium OLB17]MCZ2389565.1 hypothetical protein [Acidobacteriota bacterium]
MDTKNESGFSYIDVMIAIVILMVGILALMSGMGGAVLQARSQEQQMVAKQVAASAMESIMSVKETDPDRLGWKAIGNVGSNPDINGVPQGVFVSGFQDVHEGAGPDEIIGTADDDGPTIPNLQRQITIVDECDPDAPSYNCPTPGTAPVRFRNIRVDVRYFVGAVPRTESLQTVLTDYAISADAGV